MATGKTYGNKIRPSGQQHIDGFTSSESELAKFLYPLRWRSTLFVNDDFTGNTLDTSKWTIAKIASNGTNFAPSGTQLANGTITGITGNGAAADHVNIRSSLIWLGDNNCGAEIRLKIDNVDDIEWQFGITDALTSYTSTPSMLNDIDTPTVTNGFADGGFIGQDTGQTLTTMAYITDGSTSNMNTTKTNLGTRTFVNATYLTLRVQLAKTASAVSASSCYVLDANGALLESASHGGELASQIKGDVLLHPIFYIQTLTTASKTVDIDYISCWQDRITT
jgi:hypothetical protein